MNDSRQDDFVFFMYGRIRKAQFGLWRNLTYRQAKYDYKTANFTRRCALCGQTMKRKDVTLDHIIPLNICREYNLPQLEFDARNFRLTHQYCNMQRGVHTIDDLPAQLRLKVLSVQ